MLKNWQVSAEPDELDDARETQATMPRFAVEAVAQREMSDWNPGDGDSCTYWCQESGRPETRREYTVTASYHIELRVREAQP